MTCPLEARQALMTWILEASPTLNAESLEHSTPLFAEGHLDSMQLPELILLIEELGGREITADQLVPAAFQSLESICAHFFAPLEAQS